jgi:hypothetical protein
VSKIVISALFSGKIANPAIEYYRLHNTVKDDDAVSQFKIRSNGGQKERASASIALCRYPAKTLGSTTRTNARSRRT